jgi:hypothetical protein
MAVLPEWSHPPFFLTSPKRTLLLSHERLLDTEVLLFQSRRNAIDGLPVKRQFTCFATGVWLSDNNSGRLEAIFRH